MRGKKEIRVSLRTAICIGIIFILAIITICIFVQSNIKTQEGKINESTTNNTVNETIKENKKSNWRDAYINKLTTFYNENVKGTTENKEYTIEYYLADIDSNNIPELIIEKYTSEADKEMYVFTYKDNNVISLGKVASGNSAFYEMNNKNYILGVYAHMRYEQTYKVYIKNDTIKKEALDHMRYVPVDEEYTKGDKILESQNWDDTAIIENYGKQENKNISDYFILYKGYEMKAETGIQDITDMEVSTNASNKYNTTYYNYEKGEYVGKTKGKFGEETLEGYSVVSNVKKIAISENFKAIQRNYEVIDELPEELSDMADYTSVKINKIDLDGDGNNEHIVCFNLNYTVGEIADGEPVASSGIILMDSNYNKINDVVTLENGFWGNIKEEDKKVFLSLDDVEYIDIDKDGVMEIIIQVPTYEGIKLSIIKYNKGKLEGTVNYKASVQP